MLRPAVKDGVPEFRGGTRYVYDPHLLFRTWLALRDRKIIAIPEDMGALVESVYDLEREPPEQLSARQREHWRKTRDEHEKELRGDAAQAQVREIPKPRDCERMAELTSNFRSEDSPELHRAHQALTRLGGPSVSLICLYASAGGPALDPDGSEVLDVSVRPDTKLARRLLRRSVTVSQRGAAYRLLDVEPPGSWTRSSLLRHHRLAVFDDDGRTEVGGVNLRLDPQLGLLVKAKEDR